MSSARSQTLWRPGCCYALSCRLRFSHSWRRRPSHKPQAKAGSRRRLPASRFPPIADAKGTPLELADLDANSVKFTIAALKTSKDSAPQYQNYILTQVAGKEY